jgi:hypothetical protein
MQKRMLPLKSRRPHLYGTRRLEAGDEYEAPVEEAIAHVAMRKADFAKAKKPAPVAPENKPADPPAVPPQPQSEPAAHAVGAMTVASFQGPSLDSLRLQATQLGINVDGRWGVARLQHEIEQAKR